jgi:hypothetical protein
MNALVIHACIQSALIEIIAITIIETAQVVLWGIAAF